MPVTPPQVVAIVAPALVGKSMLGVGVPKLAQAIGIGLTLWTPLITISTSDAGTAGAGKGTPMPVIIPTPVLYANLVAGMIGQGLAGVLMPGFVLGLTNGLVTVYLQAMTNTVHAGVGVGAGVATFRPPPAFPSLQAGFAAMGMVGVADAKFARALSIGLENTFKVLVQPQPIVGPPTPTGASGRGFGSLI
jgi:hypothetical protein